MYKILLLLFVTSSSLLAQVVKTEQGYLIHRDALVQLDFLARKGLACDTIVQAGEDLIAQISEAKKKSDSLAIEANLQIFRIKQDIATRDSLTNIIIQRYNKLSVDHAILKDKHSALKRKTFWGSITALLGIVGTSYLILK